MADGKRIAWIDTAKFIGITCVVMSHLEACPSVLLRFFSPFYLTVFLFVSGYCYKDRTDEPFRQFLLRKTKQLFVPWLVFSLFSILSRAVFSANAHASIGEELLWNFLQIRENMDEIWFVAALFVAYIPFYFIVRHTNDKKKRLWAMILLGVGAWFYAFYPRLLPPDVFPWKGCALPWHIEYIPFAAFFMYAGYCFKTAGPEALFDRYNTHVSRALLAAVYLCGVYAVPELPDASAAFSLLREVMGVALVVSVCKAVKTNRFTSYIGANTVIVFGLHGKVYSIVQSVLHHYFADAYAAICANVPLSSLFVICFALGVELVLILPIWIINRYLPFIVGRGRSTQK